MGWWPCCCRGKPCTCVNGKLVLSDLKACDFCPVYALIRSTYTIRIIGYEEFVPPYVTEVYRSEQSVSATRASVRVLYPPPYLSPTIRCVFETLGCTLYIFNRPDCPGDLSHFSSKVTVNLAFSDDQVRVTQVDDIVVWVYTGGGTLILSDRLSSQSIVPLAEFCSGDFQTTWSGRTSKCGGIVSEMSACPYRGQAICVEVEGTYDTSFFERKEDITDDVDIWCTSLGL